MTTRRAQLIGYSPGCDATISWNGELVFEGSIAPVGDQNNPAVLAEWTTDTSVIGEVPFSIQCITGALVFVEILVNHWQPVLAPCLSQDAEWSIYTPTEQEFFTDMRALTDPELSAKYGLDRATMRQWITAKIVVDAETNMTRPFAAIDPASDGKNNVAINGEPQSRHDLDLWQGSWHWRVAAGHTLTCDIRVDAPPTPS